MTGSIDRRIREHKNNIFEGFTKKYHADKLVYLELFRNPTDAIAAEKKIKGWKRIRKIQLIESKNPEWESLYETFGLHNTTLFLGKDPSLRSG